MKLSKEEFPTAHQNIQNDAQALNRSGEGIFIDGALNPSVYYDQNPKILWILKEAYGEQFSYTFEVMNNFAMVFEKLICGIPRHTWAPISIISNCILDNFKPYDPAISILDEKDKIEKSLNSIAIININKDPGETGGKSADINIREGQKYYERILRKQIEVLCPDIIICGNTFQYIKHYFNSPNVIKEKGGIKYVDHYMVDDTIILDPYHPAYTAYGKIDLGLYINDIVRTVKDCFAGSYVIGKNQCIDLHSNNELLW